MGLGSCAVGPDYHPPETPLPGAFAAAPPMKEAKDHRGGSGVDIATWWRSLHDRELDSLIERAIAASPTLEIALDRLQQARAQEAVVIGAALPASQVSEGGGWGTGSDVARGRASQALVSAENGAGSGQISNLVGFDAGWEIDLFGKFRRAIEAAQYDVDAAVADAQRRADLADRRRDPRLSRLARAADAARRAPQGHQVAQNYVEFVQERFNRGITNELDVTLAQRELAQLQAQVAPLIAQIDAARYVIAVLIGEFPENLGKELTRPGLLPALPARIRSGLPIDLLRRRPDIVEAERQLASANALIGVATADLFPQLAVIGSFGWQQGQGLRPTPINPIWSAGPAVAAPLLDFGRLDAVVEKADFRTRELLFNYKQTVLNAVREVDTAIDAYAAQQDRLRHLADALDRGEARGERSPPSGSIAA